MNKNPEKREQFTLVAESGFGFAGGVMDAAGCWFQCLEKHRTMASLYNRDDSKEYWICCYPQSGGRPARASTSTEDPREAERILEKVKLLVALERMKDVPVPAKILARLEGLPGSTAAEPQPKKEKPDDLRAALRALVTRSAAGNVRAALNNKLSQLRQFFGSSLINEIDPRKPEHRRHARRREPLKPSFKGTTLADITPDVLLTFLHEKKFGLASKRHYREIFHELFRVALVNGFYVPSNPYAPNPALELPSYKGTDGPIVVLTADDVARQYDAVTSDPKILFGCQIMIEGGFRLHEALALRRTSIAEDFSYISLLLPQPTSGQSTKLKTGERPVTVRPELECHLRRHLSMIETDWLIASPSGRRWNSNAFGDRLRELNRKAKLPWTTQDFRHTFATNRIREGWNLKTLAEEMGTSVVMLMEHYAGHIAPPVRAALKSHPGNEGNSTSSRLP